MLENAIRICDAKFGNIYRWDGDALNLVATHNTPPAFAEAHRRVPFHPAGPHRSHVGDQDSGSHCRPCGGEAYIERRDPVVVAGVELGGVRTLIVVPMLKENELIGAFAIYPPRGPSIHRQADRAGHELRQPGRHRHRERAAAERAAPAHRRAWPLGRRAARARRSVAGGELDARPRDRARRPSSPRRCSSPAPKPARSTCSTKCNANFICAPPTAWTRT